MKIIILFLSVMFCSSAYADVYVVYDKATKEVVSISNEKDCVVQSNMAMDIISGKTLDDIMLASSPVMYKWDNGTFKANMQKLQDKEKKELDAYNKKQEEDMVSARMRKLAIDSLKSEGKVFKYIEEEA